MDKESKLQKKMLVKDVVNLYRDLESTGIKIWVDGGWSVDALLGRQIRPHRDLDIATQWKDVTKLRELLGAKGYQEVREDSKWNFVLQDDKGHEIDVHAFIYDDQGNIVEGIMYPSASLKGTGTIGGLSVRCLTPEYMVKALAKYINKHPRKYVQAVSELCKKFDINLPQEYLDYKK